MPKSEVWLHPRVWDFCRALPPVPRKKFRAALRGLERERGDIKPLEGRLSGYWRLRSGAYRVLFAIQLEDGVRKINCLYAEHRSVVYSILESRENLRGFLDRE